MAQLRADLVLCASLWLLSTACDKAPSRTAAAPSPAHEQPAAEPAPHEPAPHAPAAHEPDPHEPAAHEPAAHAPLRTVPTPAGDTPPDPARCGEQVCAAGQECIAYYGIAGTRGPRFESCERRCAKDGSCPSGTRCVTVADGPGRVCR